MISETDLSSDILYSSYAWQKAVFSDIAHFLSGVEKQHALTDERARAAHRGLLFLWLDAIEEHLPMDLDSIAKNKVIDFRENLTGFTEKGALLLNNIERFREAKNGKTIDSDFIELFPGPSLFKYGFSLNLSQELEKQKNKLAPLVTCYLSGVNIIENPDAGVSYSFIVSENEKKYLVKLDEGWCGAYKTVCKDVVAYQIALVTNLEGITPKTELATLPAKVIDPQFDNGEEILVSAQHYIDNARELGTFLQDLQQEGLNDEEIGDLIDQSDFEEAWLFEEIIGDQDGHFGNFLVYTKDSTAPKYGIKVIDNTYSLYKERYNAWTFLPYLPNANRPISPELRNKIAALNVDEICQMLDTFDMADAKDALIARVAALQEHIHDAQTIAELNQLLKGASNEVSTFSSYSS